MITKYNNFIIENNELTPEFYDIDEYEWNNGLLDVNQSVRFKTKITQSLNLGKIPFPFGKINGDFECRDTYLTSLENSPNIVSGDFGIKNNNLISLKYSPKEVGGSFDCSHNKITSLDYCPKKVNGMFICDANNFLNKSSISIGYNIEYYPLCIIGDGIYEDTLFFEEIFQIIKEHEDIFENLLDDKIKFHQMLMRIDSDLIKYYKNIPPPSKNSKLLI